MKFLLFLLLYSSFLFSTTHQQDKNSQMMQHVKQYVTKNYTQEIPKKAYIVKASSLKKDGIYTMLIASVEYEDGTEISTDYFEDIAFVLCLKSTDGVWDIIYDLSRNDVPSIEEMDFIKKDFPKDFPKKLLSKFWQKQFKE